MMTDPISDMLTRIRNASHALQQKVEMPHSKAKESVARILKREGYVTDFEVSGSPKKQLSITLKYQGRKGVIRGLRRVSKPGLRQYAGSNEIPRVLGGLGVSIVSTSRGLLSGREARKQNVGGEVMCFVW